MSNGGFERMSKLYTKVSMLVLDGKRNADDVSEVLQRILEKVSFLIYTDYQRVNYDRSVVDLLVAGKYDRKNDQITDKNFRSIETGEKKVKFGVFRFTGKIIGSGDVITRMKAEGFRPAKLKELLAFSEKNPGLQSKFYIIALGSIADLFSGRRVVEIGKDEGGHTANLVSFNEENGWHDKYCFLGVRK